MPHLDGLIQFYNGFAPASVARFADFYSADAYFKDPFNEVHGIVAIQRIFSHMFTQVDRPSFQVIEHVADANGAMLVWAFHFQFKGKPQPHVLHGTSHLKFDAHGKVCYHRDYWDTTEELYMKLPVIGPVVRALYRRFAHT